MEVLQRSTQKLIGNEAYRSVAKHFGLSESAVYRHQDHLPAHLVKAADAVEVARADVPLDQVKTAEGRLEILYAAAEQILAKALGADDLRVALGAIKAAVDVMGEARAYTALGGEITGELAKEHERDGDRRPICVGFLATYRTVQRGTSSFMQVKATLSRSRLRPRRNAQRLGLDGGEKPDLRPREQVTCLDCFSQL